LLEAPVRPKEEGGIQADGLTPQGPELRQHSVGGPGDAGDVEQGIAHQSCVRDVRLQVLGIAIASPLGGRPIQGGPWNYIERIEITEREAYLKELASVQNMDRLIARGRLCRRWDGWPER
jgi:hypothetical protein